MTYVINLRRGYRTLHFPSLQVGGTGHGFSFRPDTAGAGKEKVEWVPVRGGKASEEARKNRRLFLGSLGLGGYGLVTGQQVNGSRVAEAGQWQEFGVIPAADGLVTGEKGLVLSLFSADCALIFFVDRQGRAVGISHAGWRGAVDGIGKKTVDLLKEGFEVLPRDLLVGISPCIEPCCFQVREDVLRAMDEQGIPGEGLLVPSGTGDSWYLDLREMVARQLKASGIPSRHIVGTGLCTSCRPDLFYSYRRDKGIAGRMMGYVYLERKGRLPHEGK